MEIWSPGDRRGRGVNTQLALMAESADPVEAHRGRLLLTLFQCLESEGPLPRLVGLLLRGQLRLSGTEPSGWASVQVEVDWPDYGPAQSGVPVMHYRVRIKRSDSPLSVESRTQDAKEAGRIIGQVFGSPP